ERLRQEGVERTRGLRLASREGLGNGQHRNLLSPKIEALLGVDVRLKVSVPLRYLSRCPWRFSPERRGYIWFRLDLKWARLRLRRPYVFRIVGELVFGGIAEIEVTRDNRHIEVRE